MRFPTSGLFSGASSRDVMHRLIDVMKREIDAAPAEHVVQADGTEWAAALAETYACEGLAQCRYGPTRIQSRCRDGSGSDASPMSCALPRFFEKGLDVRLNVLAINGIARAVRRSCRP